MNIMAPTLADLKRELVLLKEAIQEDDVQAVEDEVWFYDTWPWGRWSMVYQIAMRIDRMQAGL